MIDLMVQELTMNVRGMSEVDQMQMINGRGMSLSEIPDFESYVVFPLDVDDPSNGKYVYYGQTGCVDDADDIKKEHVGKEDNLVAGLVSTGQQVLQVVITGTGDAQRNC